MVGVGITAGGRWWRLAIVWFCVLAATTGAGIAQDTDSQQSVARLRDRIGALEGRDDIDSAKRARATKTYKKAVAALESAESDRRQAEQLRRIAQDAPGDIRQINREIEKLGKPLTPSDARAMSRAELTTRADTLDSRLAETEATLSDLRDQLSRLARRPETARTELRAARANLQSLNTGGGAESVGSGVIAEAENALVSARRQALNAKIARLQQELSGLDSRRRLAEIKRSLAEAQLSLDNRSLAVVQRMLGARENEAAAALRQQTSAQAAELKNAAPPIAAAAQRNAELAGRLADVTTDNQALARRRARQRRRADNMQSRLNLVQRQLEIGGRSVALGDVLRGQRRELRPVVGARAGEPIPDIAAAELRRFQLQQARVALNNGDDQLVKQARQAGENALDAAQQQSLETLLAQRDDIIKQLIDADGRYIDIGRDLRALESQYRDSLASFNRLLDERLFWLPSFAPVGVAWPQQTLAQLPWLVNPLTWGRAFAGLLQGGASHWLVAGLAVLVIGVLLGLRRSLIAQLEKLAVPVGNVAHDSFWLTLRAALDTLLLVLPFALLPLAIGYLMRQPNDLSAFSRAVAAALMQLGLLVLVIEPFVQVCRRHGLADGHFQWDRQARRGLYRTLRWFLIVQAFPTVAITIAEYTGDDAQRQTLGRAGLMFSALVIAAFAWRLLHPHRGVLADVLGPDNKSHWRLGYLWLPLAVGVPLALCGLAAWGYYYTALQLQSRFFYSAGLLGACVILYSLVARWVMVAERRLALSRARRKRKEAREARATREAAAASGDSAPDNLDAPEIGLVQINEQTRGLIQIVITLIVGVGLWLIWSGTLPALNLLDQVTLWQYTHKIDGAVQLTDVTLGAVLLALAVAVGTALAGHNLPGFLEITVLRRFSLDAGSRYAVATLFQYAIVVIGLLVAISLIGVRWSSIQWLVAALGVGLGFGLQEIFANFVSGIVILFERPARVGDTVTVGGFTGTVSRIRIRATTVTDWDNKEIVIPNKTFVTETVTNWTLTNDITRLIVSVHLALDTNLELAEQLIMDAIRAEPVALDEPAPSVFMVGYDDSSLQVEGRVFYHDLYNLLPLQNALYRRIHAAFADNDIVVSFPQRDLHVRSVSDRVRDVLSFDGPGKNEQG